AAAHGAPMRRDGDARRTSHRRKLRPALEETCRVEQRIERHELARGAPALSACVQGIEPAEQPAIEPAVRTHGVVTALAALAQARQDLVDVGDWERVVRAVLLDRTGRPGTNTVPELSRRIAIAAKQ